MSDGNRNVLPAGLICIAVLIALIMMQALITTAANLKPKECWIKPAPIFVIFSNSNRRVNLPVRLIQELKTNWKIYSRKANLKLILDTGLRRYDTI